MFSRQRPLRSGAAACAAVLLGACTMLGPDYREPEIAWLAAWQSDLYGQAAAPHAEAAADLASWWLVFDDPVLDRLVDAARQDNPTLRIAGLRILESRAALGIAGSNLYPQLQQFGGAVSYVNTQQHGGVSADRNQDLIAYQGAFELGWELDFWGRFRRGIESADAAFFASITAQQDAQVLLTAQVADLYFAWRTTVQRIVIARENAARQLRSFEITERLYTSGQSAELDFQQAKTQYLATLATIPDLEIAQTRIRNALAALLGRPPGDLPELAHATSELPSLDPTIIAEIPARLLLRRPDIRTAAWQVAAQSARIGIAEADYYPAINLIGNIGWSGNTLNATPDTGSFLAGPAVTWNLFDHGRIENNVRLQDARLQQLIEAFQNTALQAAREIDDAAITVVKSREQQAILHDAVIAAERSLDLANTRYQEGYADFQRVLEAQRVLFSQAERELVNQGNHLSAIIALYKALGGGWSEALVESVVPAQTREEMRSRTDWGDLLTAPLPTPSPAATPGYGTSP
jgi:NodT family efflux transporter outer membrane factor (OMF) lipoprotein